MNAISEYKGKQELYVHHSPQILKALVELALIESAESSNRIEGITVQRNRLKPLVIGHSKPRDRSEEEAVGDTLNQKDFELLQLNRRVEIYKRTYDNLSAKIEQARIAKAAQLGEVKLVSSALEPKYPIGPKKRQNVAISGVVSLIFGTFLAFFMEFWQSSKQKTSQGRPPENKASYSEKE